MSTPTPPRSPLRDQNPRAGVALRLLAAVVALAAGAAALIVAILLVHSALA